MTAQNPHRRDDILDAAERRFTTQGYLETSVAELIADTQIAKGTFYHHFSSKEEVMNAVIDRRVAEISTRFSALADQHEIPALTRLFLLMSDADRPANDAELTSEIARDGNELMQLRAMNATITTLTPPLARLLADGVAEGTMDISDPTVTAAVFLSMTTLLIDRDLMGWQRNNQPHHLGNLLTTAEHILGLDAGAFDPLREHLEP